MYYAYIMNVHDIYIPDNYNAVIYIIGNSNENIIIHRGDNIVENGIDIIRLDKPSLTLSTLQSRNVIIITNILPINLLPMMKPLIGGHYEIDGYIIDVFTYNNQYTFNFQANRWKDYYIFPKLLISGDYIYTNAKYILSDSCKVEVDINPVQLSPGIYVLEAYDIRLVLQIERYVKRYMLDCDIDEVKLEYGTEVIFNTEHEVYHTPDGVIGLNDVKVDSILFTQDTMINCCGKLIKLKRDYGLDNFLASLPISQADKIELSKIDYKGPMDLRLVDGELRLPLAHSIVRYMIDNCLDIIKIWYIVDSDYAAEVIAYSDDIQNGLRLRLIERVDIRNMIMSLV